MRDRVPYAADWYVVTDQEPDWNDFQGLDSTSGIFQPLYNGQAVQPRWSRICTSRLILACVIAPDQVAIFTPPFFASVMASQCSHVDRWDGQRGMTRPPIASHIQAIQAPFSRLLQSSQPVLAPDMYPQTRAFQASQTWLLALLAADTLPVHWECVSPCMSPAPSVPCFHAGLASPRSRPLLQACCGKRAMTNRHRAQAD